MTLGQRIQELRKQKGWSQEALGEQLGVSRQAISRWEMDGAVPEVDKLMAMAKRFGVSLDELLWGEEREKKPEDPEKSAAADHKLIRILTITCVLLALVSVLSLVTTLYFRHQVMAIIDPPAPPDRPVTAVEYAILPDYDTRTYDLALEMATEDKKALKGWDVTMKISTTIRGEGFGPLEPWEKEMELQFKNGKASVRLEDLPFYFKQHIVISLTYSKEEDREFLQGYQSVFSVKATSLGTPWQVEENKSVYGVSPVENLSLLED